MTDMAAFNIHGVEFRLPTLYKPIKRLGSGAYGMVISAKNTKTGKKVAIKKICDIFRNMTDAKRILREIKLLNHLKGHPNITGLLDILTPESDAFDDLYIVIDFMQSDLHKIIYSSNRLSEDHISFMVYQILLGIKYCHSANVVHRDLKPMNILVNADCKIKVCDFGLARGLLEDIEDAIDEEVKAELTEYVVTRWYRAPEVMVSPKFYGFGLDMWGVGCILAEMYLKAPLFQGDNYADQLRKIFKILGSPSEAELEFIAEPESREFISRLKAREPADFSELFERADKNAIDLLEQLLQFDPTRRISLEDALSHPYFARFHNEEYVHKIENKFDTSFEKLCNDTAVIRKMMLQEVASYHPEALKLISSPVSGCSSPTSEDSSRRFSM